MRDGGHGGARAAEAVADVGLLTHVLRDHTRLIQRSAKRLVRGCEKFLLALA